MSEEIKESKINKMKELRNRLIAKKDSIGIIMINTIIRLEYEKINKYMIMNCNGEWFSNNNTDSLDFENKVYTENTQEQKFEYIEIYSDIIMPHRFFQLKFKDKTEMFVKIDKKLIGDIKNETK